MYSEFDWWPEEPWRSSTDIEKLSRRIVTPEEAEERSPVEEERRAIMPALFDPGEAASHMRERVVSAMERNFDEPLSVTDERTGESIVLELHGGLVAEDPPDPNDYGAIRNALMKRKTYGFRVRGRFRVKTVDKEGNTKRILDDRDIPVAMIPTPVFDRSYIVEGKKRNLSNQWRRRPGVFTLQDGKGDYITEFNVDPSTDSRVRNFRLWMDRSDPGGPEYRVQYGTAKKIPAWELAKLMGATERDLKKAVGDSTADTIIGRSSEKRYQSAVKQLHRSIFRNKEKTDGMEFDAVEAEVKEQFELTGFDPAVMKLTMDSDEEKLSKDVVLRSFEKIRSLANEEISADDRESLTLKRIMSPADLLAEAVGRDREVREYKKHLTSQLRKARSVARRDPSKVDVRQVLGNKISPKIRSRLTSSMLQRTDTATNPLDNFAAATLTTIMGEGAITSDKAVPIDAKLINPSHLGYLDPAHTPESDRSGVNLHTVARSRIIPETRGDVGGPSTGSSRIVSTFINSKGEQVELSPDELIGKTIGAFGQGIKKDERGKYKLPTGKVQAFAAGEPLETKASDVDYWMPDALSFFDAGSSLVPFSNSTQGNRVQYSDKQTQQAVPLVNREAPLVQVGIDGAERSMEELLGEEAGALLAKFDGEVVDIIEKGSGVRTLVVRKKGSRSTRNIPLPKNLPMGGHTPLDAEVRVKKGDKFKRGDVLSDSTFTRDGVLALGVNLRTAYMPHHSNTFEDAIAISERASEKLTSSHLYDVSQESKKVQLGKRAYTMRGSPVSKREWDALGANGVVKRGTIVQPGDVLMVGARAPDFGDKNLQEKLALIGMFGKKDRNKLQGQVTPFTMEWKEEFSGEVVDVEKNRKGAKIMIRTTEPMQAGDKMYGRHGNKGVVSVVIPNEEMPQIKGKVEVTSEGESPFRVGQELTEAEAEAAKEKYEGLETGAAHADVLFNPLGVASRLNPSQNFETALARVAVKKGEPELAKSFVNESNWQYVKDRLDEEGIPDAEDLFDPASGRTIENVGIGHQYILKAKQTARAKNQARGLGMFQRDGRVARGNDGARALGELGMYGLLAQDAREFLRDAQLYKSEDRPEVWSALRNGLPLGDYGVSVNDNPQAFRRLTTLLNAAGIEAVHDADKTQYRMRPLTDEKVVELSETSIGRGEKVERVLTSPGETVDGKSLKPRKGGLFDPKITGGMSGDKWTRFELSQSIPNPLYEKAIQDLLNLKPKEYGQILRGEQEVDFDGTALHGAEAIERMLADVDLDREFSAAHDIAKKGKRPDHRSKAYRKLRSIKMLRENEMTPVQAFMRKQIPVVPQQMRPIDVDEKGELVVGDLNFLYRDIALTNEQLADARTKGLPPKAIGQIEAGLYETMKTLLQTQGFKPMSGDYQGVLGILSGKRPERGELVGDLKSSFFKSQVLGRRQTFSGGGVLAADDSLGIDQASVPKVIMAALLEADIEAEWRKQNRRARPQEEQDFLKRVKKYHQSGIADPEVERILRRVSKKREIVVKRDPVLHKYGFQAFEPVLTDKHTLGLNPIVFSGFNADSDGDVMGLFVPLTEEANREAREKLRPTKNLFNPASGGLEYTLGHEAILGVARATRNPRKQTGKKFDSYGTAKAAWDAGEIKIDDGITVGSKKTTFGRELFSASLPQGVTFESLVESRVIDPKHLGVGVSKKGGNLRNLLEHLALQHTNAYGESANSLRSLGQTVATFSGASLTMDDLKPQLRKERETTAAELSSDLMKIRKKGGVSPADRQLLVEDAFAKHIRGLDEVQDSLWNNLVAQDRPSTLPELVLAGARANKNQLKQMLVAPVALVDGRNRVVPVPVMKSYSEGLDPTSYMTAMHGARMGAVNKVIQVQKPGFLSKQLINTAIEQVITEPDCGTNRHVRLNANDKYAERDLVGRVMSAPARVGKMRFTAGHVLSFDDVSEMKRVLKGDVKLKVRSPLKCESETGVCQKCAGYDPGGQAIGIGTNIGVQSAQALGERATQLTLSTFHGGGVYAPGASSAGNLYDQAEALLRMPSSMAGKPAVVAKQDAVVKSISPNKEKGGWDMVTEGDKDNIFIPKGYTSPWEKKPEEQDRPDPVNKFFGKGAKIRKGDILTDGVANPRDLLRATQDIGVVQDYLTDRLHGLFKREGVMRRNVETVVKSMTETVEVIDPSDSGLLPGHRIPTQKAERMRKRHPGLSFRPVLRGIDVAPRENREDWMAALNFNNIRKVVTEGAQIGATSNYHGVNPLPALAVGREFNRPRGASRGTGVY